MNLGNVKKGLGVLFWANIVGLLGVIPFIGIIAVLAAGIMELLALWQLRLEREEYRTALVLVVAGMILSLFTGGDNFFADFMQILQSIATLGATWMICTATADCVSTVSYDVADYCISVRTWYVGCMAASLIISAVMLVFSIIPLLGALVALVGSIAMLVVVVFQLIASIRFLIMLWKCQGVL